LRSQARGARTAASATARKHAENLACSWLLSRHIACHSLRRRPRPFPPFPCNISSRDSGKVSRRRRTVKWEIYYWSHPSWSLSRSYMTSATRHGGGGHGHAAAQFRASGGVRAQRTSVRACVCVWATA
jgi:hypothetical protein